MKVLTKLQPLKFGCLIREMVLILILSSTPIIQTQEKAWLRVEVKEGATCQFSYSENGEKYKSIGEPFKAREGRWIGAKVGLFTVASQETGLKGHADFDYFLIELVSNIQLKMASN